MTVIWLVSFSFICYVDTYWLFFNVYYSNLFDSELNILC